MSHSNVKTKRRSARLRLRSVHALGQASLRISNAALRTLDFKGGLDVFLLNARDEKLSPRRSSVS